MTFGYLVPLFFSCVSATNTAVFKTTGETSELTIVISTSDALSGTFTATFATGAIANAAPTLEGAITCEPACAGAKLATVALAVNAPSTKDVLTFTYDGTPIGAAQSGSTVVTMIIKGFAAPVNSKAPLDMEITGAVFNPPVTTLQLTFASGGKDNGNGGGGDQPPAKKLAPCEAAPAKAAAGGCTCTANGTEYTCKAEKVCKTEGTDEATACIARASNGSLLLLAAFFLSMN